MFSRLLLLMSFISAFTPWTFAQVPTPAAPGLTFLYTLNCTLAPAIQIGAGPKGNRVAIPIIGGSFTGPLLSGEFVPVKELGAPPEHNPNPTQRQRNMLTSFQGLYQT